VQIQHPAPTSATRGEFTSPKQVRQAIDRVIAAYNQSAVPFAWTKREVAKVHLGRTDVDLRNQGLLHRLNLASMMSSTSTASPFLMAGVKCQESISEARSDARRGAVPGGIETDEILPCLSRRAVTQTLPDSASFVTEVANWILSVIGGRMTVRCAEPAGSDSPNHTVQSGSPDGPGRTVQYTIRFRKSASTCWGTRRVAGRNGMETEGVSSLGL